MPIRNLARVAFGTAAVRYSQLGFGRTSSTTRDQATPRNLFGFKDGTNNIKAEETDNLNKQGVGGRWRRAGLADRRQLHGDPPRSGCGSNHGTAPHSASRSA